MDTEQLNINGTMVPHTIIPIRGDGTCLFRALSYLIYKEQQKANEIREMIVKHVENHWQSCDSTGNYTSPAEYSAEMSKESTYGRLCELNAAGQIFHEFTFEVYINGKLFKSFGAGVSVKRMRVTSELSAPHFDVCVPIATEGVSPPQIDLMQLLKTLDVNCVLKQNIKEIRTACEDYYKDNPEVYITAVNKYLTNHPDISRAIKIRYEQKYGNICASLETRCEWYNATVVCYMKAHPLNKNEAMDSYMRSHPETCKTAIAKFLQDHPDVQRVLVGIQQSQTKATTAASRQTSIGLNVVSQNHSEREVDKSTELDTTETSTDSTEKVPKRKRVIKTKVMKPKVTKTNVEKAISSGDIKICSWILGFLLKDQFIISRNLPEFKENLFKMLILRKPHLASDIYRDVNSSDVVPEVRNALLSFVKTSLKIVPNDNTNETGKE